MSPLPSFTIRSLTRTKPIGSTPSLDPRERANLEACLIWYTFIQKEYEHGRSAVFEDAYKSFYMKRIKSTGVWSSSDFDIYFNKLFSIGSGDTVSTINDYLQNNLHLHRSEMSFASKALHTVRTSAPVYDRVVRNYLSQQEKVSYLSNPVGKEGQERAYEQIVDWFNNFKSHDPRYPLWIDWFDREFPAYSSISDTKKIDFILLFCR